MALAGAARKGVLIKGCAHLERAGRVRCIAFDKTGTLTRGIPEVVEVISLNGVDARTIVSIAASVEEQSEHPIAQAIVRYAAAAAIRIPPGTDVLALTGLGVEGRVNGERILLGNHRLFEERHLCSPSVDARLEAVGASGRTPVLVARNDEAVGVIAVADRPRESSRDTLDLLRRQGIKALVMLTGDSQSTAQAIGRELGIDDVRAELMPEDKVEAIHQLRRIYGSVAMVGDGLNDAPALATADVGRHGRRQRRRHRNADVALMTSSEFYALRLSRATVRNIQINLAISLVLGLTSPRWWRGHALMAILADTIVDIVIANALRLLRADYLPPAFSPSRPAGDAAGGGQPHLATCSPSSEHTQLPTRCLMTSPLVAVVPGGRGRSRRRLRGSSSEPNCSLTSLTR